MTQYKTIDDLEPAGTLNATDQIELSQFGTSRRATLSQLPTTLPGPPTGTAGGDLSGSYPNPTIKPSLTNGQVMTTVGGVSAWATPSGGGGTPAALTDTSPRTYGAVGDGVTDDTAALQAAINAVNAAGGGTVNCAGGRWLIDSADLNILDSVFLKGDWENVGQSQLINGVFAYYTANSTLIVNPAFTIRLYGSNNGLRSLCIMRKGIAKQSTLRAAIDQINGFAGTGVTIGRAGVAQTGNDSYLGHLFIGGFQYGIATAGQTNGRTHIEYVSGDNTNGIALTQSFDMQHLSHVHFWPFLNSSVASGAYAVSNAISNGGLIRLTIAANVLVTGDRVSVVGVGGVSGASGPFIATVINPTTIDLQGSTFGGAYTSGGTVYLSTAHRAGTGISFTNVVDWGQMDGCFTYAYQTGILVSGSNQVTLVNCGVDGAATEGDTSTVGIYITGASEAAALIGCKTAAQGVNLKLETSSVNRDTVHVSQHRSWGSLTYAIEVADGYAAFADCEVQTTRVIRIDDNCSGVVFAGGDLTGATFSYQSAVSPRPSYTSVKGVTPPYNPVVNGTTGSTQIARFEAHYSSPAINDGVFQSYFTTDSAGTQVEVGRQTTRASTITAGAVSGQMYWSLASAGVLTNALFMNAGLISPLANDGMALGSPTLAWSDLFLASGGVINWNNGGYTLTHNGTTTVTASGTLVINGNTGAGTLGAGTNLAVRGTDNSNSLIVFGTSGSKFFYVKPETSLDSAQIAYFNGSTNANLELVGTIKFPSAAPLALNGTAVAAGSATQAFIKASATANLGIYYGTGAPAFSAAQGSLYTNTSTGTLYSNTNGSTAWGQQAFLTDVATIPQNAQTGNYTAVLADAGATLYHAVAAAAATYTIPANASVAYPIGTTLTMVNDSANAVTIAITTDTLVLSPGTTTGSRTLATGGVATALKVTATRWVINGTGLT